MDPFIGTTGPGNTYPGPTLPWGFVQPGPDTVGTASGAGGYKNSRLVNGFSQQHINGMGGPLYGEISLFPYSGDAVAEPPAIVSTGKSDESATPGYYAVTLAPWDVKVELAATKYVAFQRQTFPARGVARVLVDVGHCLFASGPPTLPKTGPGWNGAFPTGGEVHVDTAAREVSGFMEYRGGRTVSEPWKVYFVTRFDTPFASVGTLEDERKVKDGRADAKGKSLGASLTFDAAGQTVLARTSVSWRSVELARVHLAEEAKTDFDTARARGRDAWASALGRIAVEGGSELDLKRFYTALYRAHLAPNDWTGESPSRYGDRVYYENQLCMWDTFRGVMPLLTLLQPEVSSRIVNSIVNVQQVDGWTGDSHSAHQYEHVQNGSNADVIIADAFVKELPGVDWKAAYEAIQKNAFVDPDPKANRRTKIGRFRLDDYRKYRYLPTDTSPYKDTQAVSRTLEYVHNDFCIYTLALKYGTPDDVADLKDRLTWYRNLWDASSGGFMRGKTQDGKWYEPFDLKDAATGKQYYEGTARTWSWYVPHDTQGLIELNGGDETFIAKLTDTCEHYYEAYNEPCMLEPYLFIHAGRPDLTEKFTRDALKNFTVAKNGLPGNDDSGTTSSWVVWTMLGLYPNAGQPYYYIGSPTFPKARIDLGKGRSFSVIATGTSPENMFVQSATLNGKPWAQAWLPHASVVAGGELVLQMGPTPSAWGKQIRPPSVSPAK